MATTTATILEFPGQSGGERKRRSTIHNGQDEAEIIIFPGVRIERWDKSQDKPLTRLKKRASAVRRDTLNLLD